MQDEPRNSPPPDAGSSLPLTPGASDGGAPTYLIQPGRGALSSEAAPSPAWAKDLRKLYNSVVEEPLPDSFIELLSQLDTKD